MQRKGPAFSFDMLVESDGITLKVKGRLTGEAVDVLRRNIMRADFDSYKTFDLELSQVSHSDSTGLGMLIGIHRFLLDRDRQLRLIDPSPALLRLLKIAHLDQVFTITTMGEKTSRSSFEQQREMLRDYDKLQDIFSNLGAGLLAIDVDGKVLLANQTCEELTGFMERELQGQPFWALMRDTDEARKWVKDLCESHGGLPIHAQLLHEDGSRIHANLTAMALFDEDQALTGFLIGINRDNHSMNSANRKSGLEIYPHEGPMLLMQSWVNSLLESTFSDKTDASTAESLQKFLALAYQWKELLPGNNQEQLISLDGLISECLEELNQTYPETSIEIAEITGNVWIHAPSDVLIRAISHALLISAPYVASNSGLQLRARRQSSPAGDVTDSANQLVLEIGPAGSARRSRKFEDYDICLLKGSPIAEKLALTQGLLTQARGKLQICEEDHLRITLPISDQDDV